MRNKKGFTLIELLVVISIIGILVGLSIFGLQGARKSARDARRKGDLELIRSGIELYKADCNTYPVGSSIPSSLVGTKASGNTCLTTTTYIAEVPDDPLPSADYPYSSDGVTYTLCAHLEQGSGTVDGCGSCGGAGVSDDCNYKVTNP